MTTRTFIDPVSLGLVVMRMTGLEAICLCPFHSDHSPSASFNVGNGLFHCFACGESANAKSLAYELGGEVVRSEYVYSSKRHEKDDREWISRIYTAPLAYDNWYLDQRQVSNEMVKEFEIRELDDGVAFILRDVMGKPIGAQVRHYEGNPRYEFFGKKPPVWPTQTLHNMNHNKPLFVVEGVFGVLRAYSAGVSAVAVMGASSLGGVSQVTNGLNRIAAFDADFAGYLGMAKLVHHGFKALSIGIEADEIDENQWQWLNTFNQTTRSVHVLAEASKDPKRFLYLFDRYTRSSMKTKKVYN